MTVAVTLINDSLPFPHEQFTTNTEAGNFQPRVHTPQEEDFQKSLGRRFKTSIGVRISGAGYGEDNLSYPADYTDNTVDHSGLEQSFGDTDLSTTNVPNDENEEDDKSLGSESYTTSASSLSSNFCKICHCGEEV